MNKDIKLKIEEINASILIKNSQSVDINLITEDGYRVKINRIEYGKVFIYTGKEEIFDVTDFETFIVDLWNKLFFHLYRFEVVVRNCPKTQPTKK